MSDKGFYVDGMTVDEIINLGDDVIRTLSKRDISRALRTVSLAANKRIDRLMDNAIKRKGEFVEKKSAKKAIALDALNKLYDESGGKGMKFSAKGKTRNEMIAELSRAREFMSMKTSTVKGAEQVRKMREARLFGKTREDIRKEAERQYIKDFKAATGKKPTKKLIKKFVSVAIEEYARLNSDVWSNVREFMESEHLTGKFSGSSAIIELIAIRTSEGDSQSDIFDLARKAREVKYKERQDILYKEQKNFFADENAFTQYEDFDFGEWENY